jgi:branched-chain amino acid transport system substrate-binding protein
MPTSDPSSMEPAMFVSNLLKRLIGFAGVAAIGAFAATAFAQDTLKIGAAVSLTGPFSREGELLRDGYDLWKDTANAQGGIKIGGKSYKIDIVYYDDESKAQTSARLTEKLITEDKVAFLFGPYSSGIATATAAISERYKMLSLAPMATANSLYARGYKYIFTPSPLADAGLFPLLDLAASFQPKPSKIAIVGPDDLFPNVTGAGAAKRATELGLQVAYTGKYPKSATELSAVATQLKAADVDVVLATGYAQDTILLLKSMQELRVQPKMIGLAMSIGVEDFRTSLGSAAEGIMGVDYWVPTLTYKDPVFGDSAGFAKAFEAKYHKPPTYHAASGAAAGVVLQLALQKAGSLSADAVRNALLTAEGVTFYGPFKFNDSGVNTRASVYASQIVGGTPKVVYPIDVRQVPAVYPRPSVK